MEILQQLVSAVISGLIGGAVAGVAAVSAMRVELRWLRRDVDDLRASVGLERRRRQREVAT